MRITRFPSLTKAQFDGCTAAFVDSFFGELNSAAAALRRLQGRIKGAAFAYEMSLDRCRYGAMIVLERWKALLSAFGECLELPPDTPSDVAAAEEILGRVNQLIDGSVSYTPEMVEACMLAFHSLGATFAKEKASAETSAKLGPMLSGEHREAQRIFMEDLSAR